MTSSAFHDQAVGPTQSDPVLADFFEYTTSPQQDVLDFLTKRHGVPWQALCHDDDGRGEMIGSAWAVADGQLFDFADETDDSAAKALIFVARDPFGDLADLVAWWPRQDRVASQCGRVVLLGEHEIDGARIGEPLSVHRSPLGWLQAGRRGVVIIDVARAWRALEGNTLLAASIDHGLELRRILSAPAPRILVRDARKAVAA